MNAAINTIITNNNGFELIIDGMEFPQVFAALNEAGIECGKTSLRKVLNGAGKACGLERIERAVKVDPAAEVISEVEVVKPAADVTSILNPRKADAVSIEGTQTVVIQPAAAKVEEAKAETKGVETANPAAEALAVPGEPAAKVIKSVRRGTKNDIIFKLLCRPEGATIKEIIAATGWSEGGASSVLYWEPQAKGYDLLKEKVAGRGTVCRMAINGVAITEEQIVYA